MTLTRAAAILFLAVAGQAGPEIDADSPDVVPPEEGVAVKLDLANADLSAMNPKEVLARLEYSYGGHKDVTVADAFALALLIHGETWGGATEDDARYMIWAMAQRSYWSPTWNKYPIAKMCYAFSQPINPIWREGGKMCSGEQLEKHPNACSEKKLAKRAQFASLKWKNLCGPCRKGVIDWLEGRLPNPVPGAVGWLAPSEWRKEKGELVDKIRSSNFYHVKWAVVGDNVFTAYEPLKDHRDKRGVGLDSRGMDGSEVVLVARDGTRSTVVQTPSGAAPPR
jgi:hypothetical protein